MKIPTAPAGGSVDLRGPSNARVESLASPALYASAAEPLAEAGKGMLSAGAGLGAVVQQIQDRDNLDAVFKAEAALKEGYLGFHDNVRKTRQGDAAKGVTTTGDEWFKKTTEEVGKGLENDAQRRAFTQKAAQLRISGLGQLADWENAQGEAAAKINADKNKAASRRLALEDPINIDKHIADIDQINRAELLRQGLTNPNVLKAANLADTTALHYDMVQRMVEEAPMAAKDWYDKAKANGQIDPEHYGKFDKMIKVAVTEGKADEAVKAVLQAQGPKKDGDPFEIDKLTAALDARPELKNDPAAMKAAKQNLREAMSTFVAARNQRTAVGKNSIFALGDQGLSISAIRRSKEYLTLAENDRETADAAVAHIESERYSRFQRGRGYENAAEADLIKKNAGTLFDVMDPARLVSMSRDEVKALREKLGVSKTAELLHTYDTLKSDKTGAKLSEANVDRQDFVRIVSKVVTNVEKPSQEEKLKLDTFQSNVENAISLAQQAAKRPLTRQEKQKIMQDEIDNTVLLHNTIFPDQEIPAGMITKPEDLKRAYVEVPVQQGRATVNKRVSITSIPEEDRAAIISGLRKRGITPTYKNIAKVYADTYPEKVK